MPSFPKKKHHPVAHPIGTPVGFFCLMGIGSTKKSVVERAVIDHYYAWFFTLFLSH
jgi:hypothetical protein